MRILLVNPPKSNKNLIMHYANDEIKQIIKSMGISAPPLALCSIAGNLKDCDVEIFDFKAEYDLGLKDGMEETIIKKYTEFNPDIVAVTVLTSDFNASCRILQLAKEFNPSILTIAGGVHVSLIPLDFNEPYIDIAIIGQGKKIFREVVLEHKKKGDFSKVPNIFVQKEGRMNFTKSLDLFKEPKYLLSDVYANRKLVKKYDDAYRTGAVNMPISFIETTYGCPYRCNFCSIWPVNSGSFYCRPIDDVIGEIKATMEDYKLIRFADANTMGDIEHSTAFFERLINENIQKVYVADVRNDTAANNPELIARAAEAGLKVAVVGIESVNEKELKYYNKESSRDIILRSIEVFKKYNVDIRGLFIVSPDYDYEDFQRLEEFTRENDLKVSNLTIMTPFPGTPLYNEVKDKIIIKDYDYYNLFNSVLKTKLPEEEFYKQITGLRLTRQGIRGHK